MPAPAIGIVPGGSPLAPPAAPIRIVPISATEAFLIAPHATLGAVALHLIHGNGPTPGFTAADAGGVAGGWRIQGFRILPSVASNPVSQATETVYQGFGSQQIAINVANIWAGHLHGFGVGAAYSQTAPNLTQAGMIAATPIGSQGDFKWTAATGAWSDSFTLNADGSISTSATVTLAADPLQAYLDMTIVGAGFTRASLDGGATWLDLGGMAQWQTLAASVPSILLRNPKSGTTVTIADDALGGSTQIVGKVITCRTTDYKIYVDLNPLPGGTHLGSVSVERTISFGASTPDPTVALSASISQNEGNSDAVSYTYTVTRSSAVGVANIPWTFSAGTTQASDYVGGAYPAGGTVAFADGQASATFAVQGAGDTMIEGNESFSVAIRNPLGYAPGASMSATGTMLNDDSSGPAYVWDGVINGNSIGSTTWNPLMRSWDDTAKQYVFDRSGGGYSTGSHRSLFPITGLTAGVTYQMTITGTITGASPSAGCSMSVSTDGVNGSGGSGGATMSAAYATGTTPYVFTATAATMYFLLAQGYQASSGQTFRLSRLGAATPI